MDLRRRSMGGIVVYALMLPGVFWPFDFHTLQPQLSTVFALSMLGISLLRLVHWIMTASLYRYSPSVWRNCFTLLSLAHASVLSVFFVFAIYDERFTPILHVTMLAIGGIASSALIALTPRIRLALTNLSLLLGPSIICGFVLNDKLPYAMMILLYVGFISLIGIRSSREYTRSFEIETMLDEQKAVLEQLNKIDDLTNIYNRGYFNIEFEKQWQLACRQGTSESLMLIDIDHFKDVNDKHGHLVGDACIIQVAKIISNTVKRRTDLVARYGGEEFVAVLRDCEQEEALSIAESVRQAIANTPLMHEGKSLTVTASIGLVSLRPTFQMKATTMIDAADKALYQAKAAGRNKVVVYEAV